MSVTTLILRSTANEYDVYDQLCIERDWRQQYGFDTQELEDAIQSMDDFWVEQQRAEMEAETAAERYYENRGYDTDGIWR